MTTTTTVRAPRRARLSDAELPPLDQSIPPWPGQPVRLPSAELYVRRTPPAPGSAAEPALYVHGLGGASTNWTDLAALLSTRLAGEAPDLPGFGRSGPPLGRNYSLTAQARAIVELLEQRGRGPVHLFGNSMGGAISVLVAATRPDLVRTLTLVSPAMPDLRPRRGSDPAIPLMLMPGMDRLVAQRLRRMSPEARVRALLALCYADPGRVPPNRVAEAAAEVRIRNGQPWAMDALSRALRGLVAAYLTPGARSLWRLAGRITAPTLVVWGTEDRLVNVALAPRTALAIPDSRLLVLPDIGHTAQLEDPLTVARAVVALHDDTRP
jgi:pimeloyl-ACP methyl ester carboxylesterase